jgi:hypothetical protein
MTDAGGVSAFAYIQNAKIGEKEMVLAAAG